MKSTPKKKQLLCIRCGAIRPKLTLPERREMTGLSVLFASAFANLALSCANSTIPETRRYWREKLGLPQ